MEIILVRHGETEWNVKKIFRGRKDIGLSDKGFKQAEYLGKYLSDMDIEAIYSSPLRRAIDTANQIAKFQSQNKIIFTDDLVDFNYGEWEGKSEDEVKEKYGSLFEEWYNEPSSLKIPGGEKLNDVRERALRLIDEVINKYKKRVVLVSHRVVNKVLICALLELDHSHFWNIKLDLGGITVFNYQDSRFILIKHNDTTYLQKGLKHLNDF